MSILYVPILSNAGRNQYLCGRLNGMDQRSTSIWSGRLTNKLVTITIAFLFGFTPAWMWPAHGQTNSFRELENRVYQYNNALKYTESQALLLPVLQSETFSADEKYQAALLLSYTYKRLLDYQSTLHFLEMARQFAHQTPKKEQYLATVLSQEAFVYFDIHQYPKADSLMTALETTRFRHIDLENKAKLVMQQGYLQFLDKHYQRAESTYDKAIGWLRVASPCDLPMIYVKKMQTYAAMNRMDLLQNALTQSTRSADSCGIIKYHIYAYDELLAIYKKRNDVAGIANTTRTLDSLNKQYAQAERIAALHTQREAIMLGDNERKLQHEQQNGRYLTIGVWGLGGLMLGLLVWLLLYRQQNQRLEVEFERMKRELDAYLTLSRQQSSVRAFVETRPQDILSERQREVLNYLSLGLSNREIADKLFVSENTVKYHIKNIYQLLEIKDRKYLLANYNK